VFPSPIIPEGLMLNIKAFENTLYNIFCFMLTTYKYIFHRKKENMTPFWMPWFRVYQGGGEIMFWEHN
jgi:hypothetical protein